VITITYADLKAIELCLEIRVRPQNCRNTGAGMQGCLRRRRRLSTHSRHSLLLSKWAGLAVSGLAALGNRNIEADIRFCIASGQLSTEVVQKLVENFKGSRRRENFAIFLLLIGLRSRKLAAIRLV